MAARALNASALAMAALERVEGIEDGRRSISANINQTMENVREAGTLLEDAEFRCKSLFIKWAWLFITAACLPRSSVESIQIFLNETRGKVQQLVVDTTTFIGENNNIIREIDSLIANLEDVHKNINRVTGLEETVTFKSTDRLSFLPDQLTCPCGHS